MTTDELMLNRATGRATPEDYIAWAVGVLVTGQDTPALRILAGLNATEERHDIEPYFVRSVAELGLEVPAPDSEPRDAAPIVRRLFETGVLTAEETVVHMSDLYRRSGYWDPLLGIWLDIEEEILARDSGYEGVFYPSAAIVSLDATVRLEWSLFDRAVALDVPEEYHRFVRCGECSHIGLARREPSSIVDRLRAALPWLKRGVNVRFACSACGSSHYTGMSDPDVRDDYFARLESAGSR